MTDKRDSKRHGKRLRLKFGTDQPERIGFTEDISLRGLFITTTNIYQPGNLINIKLDLPNEESVTMAGRIMWAKKVPPLLIQRIKKSGMGVRIVRITAGKEAYYRFCEEIGIKKG